MLHHDGRDVSVDRDRAMFARRHLCVHPCFGCCRGRLVVVQAVVEVVDPSVRKSMGWPCRGQGPLTWIMILTGLKAESKLKQNVLQLWTWEIKQRVVLEAGSASCAGVERVGGVLGG